MNTTASLLPVQAVRNNLPGMLDLILRGRRVLDGLIRDERALPQTTQQLLALALLGIAVHGLVLGGALHLRTRLRWTGEESLNCRKRERFGREGRAVVQKVSLCSNHFESLWGRHLPSDGPGPRFGGAQQERFGRGKKG